VKISYKNKKLEKQLTDPIAMIKTFGQLAKKNQSKNKGFISCRKPGYFKKFACSEVP
jgi:hypothetical protein